MTDLVVTVAGIAALMAAGYVLAVLWLDAGPRPVQDRDGVWRAGPRNRSIR